MKTYALTENQLLALETAFPTFRWLELALERNEQNHLLNQFYVFVLEHSKDSKAQLFQDLFVDFIFSGQEKKRFIEFGATDGVERSNTWMLEQVRGWTGVLAEADPQWHDSLKANRDRSVILTDCIYSKTGETLKFISSSTGELSTLRQFSNSEENTQLHGNFMKRMGSFSTIKVNTISINDVFDEHFSGETVSYMSVDTEGSEYEILSHFDFEKYKPLVVTVEHNFTDTQARLDTLFAENDYARIFPRHTDFDAWYVDTTLAKQRGLL